MVLVKQTLKSAKIESDAHTKIKVKASKAKVSFQVMLSRVIDAGLKAV